MTPFVRIAAFLACLALPFAHAQYYDPEIPEDRGLSYTALWWVPSESGWGLNTNHQDNKIFATLFTYAPDGQPMWLVASGLARLNDAGRKELSLTSRFDLAYNAGHAFCLAALRRRGFRPGKRYVVF